MISFSCKNTLHKTERIVIVSLNMTYNFSIGCFYDKTKKVKMSFMLHALERSYNWFSNNNYNNRKLTMNWICSLGGQDLG